MSLAISTISNSIAGLTVTGVTLKDIDEIPNEVNPFRDCPVLFPEPINFVTDFGVVRDSFGADATARKSVEYTLNYTFCHSAVGTGRLLKDVYDDMVTKAFAILDAIMSNSTITGLVDMEPENISNFGVVLDPAGKAYHGCQIALRVLEFVN